jgi:dolichyl-phosphate-mannose--protein O-mannosyl transferase
MLLGNPAVWWVGFACIILLISKAVPIKLLFFKLRKKLTQKNAPPTVTNKPRTWDLAAIFIVAVFFFQWLPYMLISRITYIYHFYVNVPILCLASAYFLNKIWGRKYGKAATAAYLAVVVAVFILFYAVISGMPTSSAWIDSLKLFGKSWLRP